MLAIVLNHTDIYLVGTPVISFDLFGTNALMTFFVVSGYLFFREGKPFDMKRKVKSEFRHLVVPYFIFTLIIALPKAFVHGTDISLADILLGIVCGQASWFVAARALAGVIFAALITLACRFCRWILPLGCVLLALLPFLFDCDAIHIWNADIALMSLVYLYIGYLFHANESVVSRYAGVKLCLPVLLVVVVIKFIEGRFDIRVPVSPALMTSFPVFFIDTILSAFVVITFCRRFNGCRFINFVGRNSIVFYFLCGGVPLLTGMAFRHFGLTYSGNYLIVLADFAVVVAVMSLLTIVIVRYFPFMIGRSRTEYKRENGQIKI